MNTVTTIPKKITKGEELVVIPRVEYEELRAARVIQVFKPTTAEKKDLTRARRNRASGKYLTVNELKRKLGFTS